mmetsp:Transcript_20549/g.31330  ORF Transcript_20549/g.31330 Transcript_20549/m.31330 type:complete len:119 (-) Transcript_20549:97-453(-)
MKKPNRRSHPSTERNTRKQAQEEAYSLTKQHTSTTRKTYNKVYKIVMSKKERMENGTPCSFLSFFWKQGRHFPCRVCVLVLRACPRNHHGVCGVICYYKLTFFIWVSTKQMNIARLFQ